MQRFTISLDDPLAAAFDRLVAERGHANRSEAVRDLLRAEIERSRQRRTQGLHGVACLSYVYNHHERELGERLTRMHHARHDLTLATMHAHLDHDHCLEAALLRGPAAQLRAFADGVCAERGVHHGGINLISVEPHQHHRHDAGGEPHLHLRPAS